MKYVGKARYLSGEIYDVFYDVGVQRAGGSVNLGVRDGGERMTWHGLSPDEARKVARWLLKAADKAERYTPDE